MKLNKKFVACLTSALMLMNPFCLQASACENDELSAIETIDADDSSRSVTATSMYVGHVQFTGTNTGAWRTVPGNHVRMCIAFKPVDGISYSTELYVYLEQYPNVYIGQLKCDDYTVTPDSDGYYFFVSNYFTINPYSDCRLSYLATSSGTSYDPRMVDVHAWYDYY